MKLSQIIMKIYRQFLWAENIEGPISHKVSCEAVCLPKRERGLGRSI